MGSSSFRKALLSWRRQDLNNADEQITIRPLSWCWQTNLNFKRCGQKEGVEPETEAKMEWCRRHCWSCPYGLSVIGIRFQFSNCLNCPLWFVLASQRPCGWRQGTRPIHQTTKRYGTVTRPGTGQCDGVNEESVGFGNFESNVEILRATNAQNLTFHLRPNEFAVLMSRELRLCTVVYTSLIVRICGVECLAWHALGMMVNPWPLLRTGRQRVW